jgi:imidazolonepropionase-like amidohydrolase
MGKQFMKINRSSVATLLTVFSFALISPAAPSQVVGQTPKDQPPAKNEGPTEEKDSASKQDKDADAKSKDDSKVLAIVGGDIHTVSREVIRSGTILVKDGKITAVGQNVEIPEGAETIDAKGLQITPGFIALEMSRVGVDSNVSGSNKLEDSLDPFDRNITLALGVGITTGCVATSGSSRGQRSREPEDIFLGLEPDTEQLIGELDQSELDYGVAESLCPCCGLPILPTDPITDPTPRDISASGTAVIKMTFGRLDGMLVDEDAFYDVSRGSLTGALNRHTWRQQIAKARKYLDDVAKHEKATKAGKKENPPRKSVDDALLKLVRGESRLRISAESVSEIRDMVELAEELDYKLTLQGASEAWLVPDLLAENDVTVTMTPRSRRRSRLGEEATTGSWVEMPRVLEETGVPFAITALSNSISLNGLAGRDLTSLPLEAAFAVRGGASESEALKAITLTPATMLGLQDRIGSIEVGKDADLLLLDGSPLDYRTYVQQALVNGEVVYQRDRERAYPVFERR